MLLARKFCALLAGAACAGACAAADIASLAAAVAERGGRPVPAYLQPWIERDAQWGAQHRVLLQMAAGRAAFLRGDWAMAEALFADAQQEVETIYADNPKAQAARRLFVPESTKDFKGDPYERAMLGIYLGLIDLSRGEFDNARAGFRFAQLQDTLSASEEYQDDMALAQYLVGWTYWCEGSPQSAQEEFARARKLRPDLAPPAPDDRLLMLAEVGAAPVKFRSGAYGELQMMRRGEATPLQQVAFRILGADGVAQVFPATLAEDVYFQASTRGGAAVDSIRAGKASFRQGADSLAAAGGTVGTAALGVSAIAAYSGNSSRELAGVGLVAGVVALAAKGVASSTETQADIRYWINLPEKVYLRTAPLPVDGAAVEAGYYTFGGVVQQSAGGPVRHGPGKACAVFHSHAADAARRFATPADWPRLPALVSAPGLASLEHLLPAGGGDIDAEGAALLDSVRTTREAAR